MTAADEQLVRTSIAVICKNGHAFRVKRKYAGKRGRCPECSANVAVPAFEQQLETDSQRPAETICDPSSEDVAPSVAVQRLGRFQIEGILGEGAFGTVYFANDPQLDRSVALKVPRSGALGGRREMERFVREARAAAQLRHPNIVPIYDAGEIDGTYYIASAYISPGRTLGDLLSEQDRLAPTEAARLIEHLAKALHYAHTLGVVHRDIKPDNILLDDADAPHIADFGLARRDEGTALLTQENVRMGTPAYMSPEQHAGKSREADARSDLWALGVILYEMLTGERPFLGNDVQLMYAVRELEPDAPRKKVDSIPRDLETICLKCLAKEPDGRYHSCDELAAELRRWQSSEPIKARRTTIAGRLWRWSKRNPAIARLMAAVVVITLLGLAGILWKWADAEGQRIRAETFADDASGQRDEAQRQAKLASDNADRAERQKALAEDHSAKLTQKTHELDEKATELQTALKDAEDAKQLAETAKGEAENNFSQLVEQKQRADEAATAATSALAQAEKDKLALQSQLYVNNIALADREIQRGNIDRARFLLTACQPEYRSWEWCLLAQRANLFAALPLDNLDETTVISPYSPDGKLLVIQGPHEALIWNNETQQVLSLKGRYTFSRWSPDGTRCEMFEVSDGIEHLDKQLRPAWAGKNRFTYYNRPHPTWHVEWDWNDRRIVFSTQDGSALGDSLWWNRELTRCFDDTTFEVVEVTTGKRFSLKKLIETNGSTIELFSPNGKLVALGRDGHAPYDVGARARHSNALVIYDIDQSIEHVVLDPQQYRTTSDFGWSPAGDFYFFAGHLFHTNSRKEVSPGTSSDWSPRFTRWDPPGTRLLCSDDSLLWNPTTGEQSPFHFQGDWVGADGRFMSGSVGPIRGAERLGILNLTTLNMLYVEERLPGAAKVDWASSASGHVWRIEYQSGGLMVKDVSLRDDEGEVFKARNTGSGRWRVCEKKGRFALLTDAGVTITSLGRLRDPTLTLKGSDAVRVDSSFPWALRTASPDGQMKLAVDGDVAVITDMRSNKEVRVLSGHKRRITAASWHPHLNRVVTASVDGTVRLWDPLNDTELLSLEEGLEPTNPVTMVGWSDDGKRLAIRRKDIIKVLDTPWSRATLRAASPTVVAPPEKNSSVTDP